MLELRIKHGRRQLSPAELAGIIGPHAAIEEIGSTVDALITLMDLIDGDVDEEPGTWGEDFVRAALPESCLPDDAEEDDPFEFNGDELDGSAAEDDFMFHGWDMGAGCPVSDPDEDDDQDHGIEYVPHDPQPPLTPEYDEDQTAGPNNFAYELQCHDLKQQIRHLEGAGQAETAARTRAALGKIQARRRETIAARQVN